MRRAVTSLGETGVQVSTDVNAMFTLSAMPQG